MSFNWTQFVVDHQHVHVATFALSSAALVGMGFYARNKLGSGQEAIAPVGRFSIRGLVEMNVEFIAKLAQSVIGPKYVPYVPFFAAMFALILFNNLIGVIPGMTPATENINTTFAFGVFSFLVYNYVGLKHGGLHYLKHFLGPVWYLAPLMLVIELISHFIRPLTLGLRLANVMTGDHTVLSVFLSLVPYPILIPIPFYLLGFVVSLIQAFVFTLLSMVYISLAVADEH